MKRIVTVLLILTIIAVTVVSALVSLQPPDPVPGNATPGVFSSGRAMKHLKVIAAHPHSIGSPAHDQVRDYIISVLVSMGYTPVVQKTTSFNRHKSAVIENIITRIKGKSNTQAVLLAAHYDSRFIAPGAGDNGSNVAAILETLRALKYQSPMNNDLIVLFSDGEEESLLGSRAFIEESPLARGIGIALNFDGRGMSGRSVMFETSPGNGTIIRALNRAGLSVSANSLMFDASRLLPNYTDFTWFMTKIPAGMNFANIGSVEHYHSVNDKVENFDERTLQSHGNAMLQSVLHFGRTDLRHMNSPDVVYFNFLFPKMIIYPVSFVIPFAFIATILFIIFLVLGYRKNQIRAIPLAKAFVLFLLRILVTGLIVFFLWKWLGPLHPEFKTFELEWIHGNRLYVIAFLLLATAGILAFQSLFVRKSGLFNVTAGAFLVWMLVVWGSSLFLPGGSYLFVWPFMLSVSGMILFMFGEKHDGSSLSRVLMLIILAVPGIWIFTQIICLLFQALTLMAASVLVVLVILLSGTLQVPVLILSGRKNLVIPLIAIAGAALFIATALMTRQPSEQKQLPDTLFYTLDMDNQEAKWVTWDRKTDDWTSQFFPGKPAKSNVSEFLFFDQYGPSRKQPLISSGAEVVILTGPKAEVLDDERGNDGRLLKVRFSSGDSAILFIINPEKAAMISGVSLNDKWILERTGTPDFQWPLMYFCGPGHGFEMTLTVTPNQPVAFRIVEVCEGLPAMSNFPYSPRPGWTIPLPGFFDATLVTRTIRF